MRCCSRSGGRFRYGFGLLRTAEATGGLLGAGIPYVAGLALAVCGAGMDATIVLLDAAAPAEGPDHPASADRAPGLVCRSRAAWV
ncbi:hypothetical protein [Amycolatopsis thermoflava]|uniref:hypothetical protein n=1 Tax=Amycolatopsis thermoflava TaxID=84480 RepID=UPI003D71205C